MSYRDELIAAIRQRQLTAEALASQMAPGVNQLVDIYLDELLSNPDVLEALGFNNKREALGDIAAMDRMRSEIMTEVLAEIENPATVMDNYQEQRNADLEGTDAIAYVYLGPDDASNRPFCNALEQTWLTRAEIDRLDNGQTGKGTAWVARGGYNCRHGWYGLFTEEERDDFLHGRVDEANAAALR